MAQNLLAFLQARSRNAFKNFCHQIEGLTPEQAIYHARPNWPGHQWGIGQNGSIAGIVYHVAAWKQATLPILIGEESFSPMEHPEKLPPPSLSWNELCTWYHQIGEAWCHRLANLQEADLDRSCYFFEEHPTTLCSVITEIMLHDVHHAAQIEYLRQHLLAEENGR